MSSDFSKLLRLFVEEGEEDTGAGTGSGVEKPTAPATTNPITIKSAKDPGTLFMAYLNVLNPLWKDMSVYLTDVQTQLNETASRLEGTFDASQAAVKDQGLTTGSIRKVTAVKPNIADKLAAMRGQYSGPRVQRVKPGKRPEDTTIEDDPSGARRFGG